MTQIKQIEEYLSKFGLYSSQMRSNDMIHNGGWYDSAGHKIGWGDLNPEDVMKISKNIEKDQVFFVLSESDSHWAFVTFANDKEGNAWKLNDPSNEYKPMLEYVLSKARWVITPGQVSRVPEYRYENDSITDGGKVDTSNWGSRYKGLEAIYEFRKTMVKRLGHPPIEEEKIQAWLTKLQQDQQERRKNFSK